MSELDVDRWLDANWDPDLTVGEWWQRLADVGLTHPALPEPWGRGWSVPEVSRLVDAMVARGALGPPMGMGLVMGAPTLLAHAAEELRDRLVGGIGGGNNAAPSGAVPGTIAGHLARRAGSFAHEPPPVGDEVVGSEQLEAFIELARENGTIADAPIRQDLMRLHTMIEIQGWHI